MKANLNIFLIFLYSFLIHTHTIFCQEHEYRQYTLEDGLPSNYVYGVVEDDKGFIWVFSEGGVSKFDGYQFKNFNTSNGLPAIDNYYMFKDDNGRLWLDNTSNTPCFILNDTIRCLDLKNQFGYGIQKRKGKAVISFDNKYAIYEGDSLFYLNANDQNSSACLPNGFGRNVFIDKNTIYCITRDLSNVYINKKNDSHSIETNCYDILEKNLIRSISILEYDTESLLYFSTDLKQFGFLKGDKFECENHNWNEYYQNDGRFNYFTLQDSTFLVNSTEGFIQFDKYLNVQKRFTPSNLSNKFYLLRTFIDSKGNYWIGSKNGGLFFISQSSRKTKKINQSNSEIIQSLFVQGEDLLAISNLSNIYSLEVDKLVKIQNENNLNFNEISSLNNEAYFVCTDQLPFVLDNSKNKIELENIPFFKKLNQELLNNLKLTNFNFKNAHFDTTKNEMWLSRTQMTVSYDGSKATLIKRSKCLDFEYNQENELILLFNDGVFTTEKDTINKIFNFQFGTLITHISGQEYLIANQNGEVFQCNIKDNSQQLIGSFKSVKSIKKFRDQYFLATSKGVVCLKNDQGVMKIVYIYDSKDGLPSEEILDIHVNKKVIIAASGMGMVSIQRYPNTTNNAILNIVIDSIFVNKKMINRSQNNFAHYEKNIDIHYNLIDFASDGNLKFQYKLEPRDTQWIETSDRKIQLKDLKSNHYTLQIKSQISDGRFAYLANKFTFYIPSPWYNTGLFKTVFSLISLCLIWILFKRFEKKQHVKMKAERALNKKMANLQLEALRSQMNPHFVFNALGAIQYYIQTHKTEAADNYLTLFARLMRKYLDSSKEKTISLSQETALLKDYTDIEMMRFEDGFKTSIHFDKTLSLEDIEIPSMLIQPFVENAINHGLPLRTDGNGWLEISFKKFQHHHLLCEINDNGIGREAGRKNKIKKHKSRGMDNVSERIETLRKSGNFDIEIIISDLNSKAEFPGTSIKIILKNNL